MNKEIIVAIDGSLYSDHSIAYLSALFAEDTSMHIHLCSWITASSSIMPSLAESNDSLIPPGGQDKKKLTAGRYLEKTKAKLQAAGLKEKQLQSSIFTSGYNIAAAIQQHVTQTLPDALLLGRHGFKGITKIMMGSVSAEIFRKCHSTPLWIIDGSIKHKDFFVAVDGTVRSLLAVDHLAHILRNRNDIHICLFHYSALFGKKNICDPEQFTEHWDKEWCNRYLSGTDCLFRGPRQILLEAGIPEAMIRILPQKSGMEEAHGIIKEARKQQCGTIVMGRRKAGMAKGLFGGVSDRTIERVEDLALWIIG